MKKVVCVLCTTKNIEEAREIAKGALTQELVACASIIQPVESWFVWNEQIEQVQEVQLILKTTVDKYPNLEAFITSTHCYEVPEILVLPVENGFLPYLKWINESVEST